MEKWEVVVVGAGPGGSSAAKRAAELGLKTVFFERGRKPGEKNASGCGLGQRWWRDFPDVMESIGELPSVRKVEMVVINLVDGHNRLRYRSGTTGSDLCATRWPHGMDGVSVYRRDLDPLLAGLAVEAGAELRTSTKVMDVVKENGRVKGVVTESGEKVHADVVIAADGAMSTMARKAGLRNRWGGGCTLVPQLDFSCDPEKLDDVVGNAEWVWFGPLYGAYQVNFRDGFHVGAGQGLRTDWDQKPVDMVKRVLQIPAFQAMCRSVGAEPREYQAHLLPWLKELPKTYTAGMMLVGDAAGFPCPLEAEGIWHAWVSGKIAAETAAWALSRGSTSGEGLSEYERRWKASALGKEHEFGEEFVELWNSTVFNPRLMERQIQLLLEFSMLHPFSIVFDWGDAHIDCFNQHLEHFFDMVPEFSGFGRTYLLPLARGIWPKNVKRILLSLKPRIPVLKRLPDSLFLKMVGILFRGLAPFLDPHADEESPLPKAAFGKLRRSEVK